MSEPTENKNRFNKIATKYAIDYINGRSEKKVAKFEIGSDTIPAYVYLAEEWLKWNDRQVAGAKTNAEKAQIKKLQKLFEGLTDYFQHSNEVQEDLVKLNTEAAQKALLAEGLLVALDQNPHIKTPQALEDEVYKTIEILLPGSWAGLPKEAPDGLIKAIQQTTLASSKTKSRSNSAKLRSLIQDWVKDATPPYLENHQTAITGFHESRKNQTKAFNNYQTDLVYLEKKIMTAINVLSANKTKSHKSLSNLEDLWIAVGDRIEQVEAFRNGLIRQLPPQAPILNSCPIGTAKVDKIFNNGFLLPGKKSTISLTDIPESFRDLDRPAHPLVANTKQMQNGFRILINKCHNPVYQKDKNIPELDINENGVKSWKRSIDKLIYDKGCNWKAVTDLCRINVIFDKAETLFFFNQLVREGGKEQGWKMDPPTAKGSTKRDRGMKMQETGSLNWHMNMQKEYPFGTWTVEAKLNDRAQYNAELVSHKIYECIRRLEDDDRNFDPNNLTPERYEIFNQFTARTIGSLLNSDLIQSDELHKELESINLSLHSSFHRDGQNIEDSAKLFYHELKHAHFTNCASAATNASPSMAALYAHEFEKLTTRMEKNDPNSSHSIQQTFEKVGPKLKRSRTAPGQYDKFDKKVVETLTTAHLQGWEQERPTEIREKRGR